MLNNYYQNYYQETLEYIQENIFLLLPKIFAALILLILGFIIAFGTYRVILYVFKKLRISERINSLYSGIEKKTSDIVDKDPSDNIPKKNTPAESVNYARLTAKAISYYVFLLFFRWSVVVLGIRDIEKFMQDLLAYLPSLFVGIMIGFFGLRFANSIHDIILQASRVTKDKTGNIIAMGAKIIVMFFTLMIVLNYIKIVDQFIINALFIGFICTLTLAFGLAFGFGGRDIARDILESFRK